MSVGADTQTVALDKPGLTLVMGENLDLGGGAEKNGVGKSSLMASISYALYGQALANIKRDNLINNINKKNMMVAIEFEKNGTLYRIERGRKPNYFKYIVDGASKLEDAQDESQGEGKETQREIDRLLGISHTMFKHIVALNTYTEPFLQMPVGKQREIIEELLGITLLSQKAENLRELIKVTKTGIEQEEFKISTLKNSNAKILAHVEDLKAKESRWNRQTAATIQDLQKRLDELSHLDVEAEILVHKNNAAYREVQTAVRSLRAQLKTKTSHLSGLKSQQTGFLTQYARVQDHNCAACGQTIHDGKREEMIEDLELKITGLDKNILDLEREIAPLQEELEDIQAIGQELQEAKPYYSSIDQAYDHRNSCVNLENELARTCAENNPFAEQVLGLNNTLEPLDYETLNELGTLKDHQEFLLKLLVNKDSFIRKRIVDQNLGYLNHRLGEYLTSLNLPHAVRFSNDLGVEISYMGQDFDFAQLSRGESTRVILSLSWAFRDIFENSNDSLSFMAVDELLDSGLDASGLEKAIECLKKMARDRGKNVMLISHREELAARCSQTLTVVKEDGFSRFDFDYEA